MTDVITSLRRQKSVHPMPAVNLCGAPDGCRVEIYGEELGTYAFIQANITYEKARRWADLAVVMLDNALNRRGAL